MDKLERLIRFALSNNNEITSAQAYAQIGDTYYCNGAFHISQLLSRAVKAGKFERIKKGVFRLRVATTGRNPIIDCKEQIKLL